ncbi:hypothetical protein BGZ63DRAFT_377654 [Mariannaea sp. PMI_226]|nr:hypothetical protein BGZ63DRAFT_377654 [Mariannaea sp. PMI_226]
MRGGSVEGWNWGRRNKSRTGSSLFTGESTAQCSRACTSACVRSGALLVALLVLDRTVNMQL